MPQEEEEEKLAQVSEESFLTAWRQTATSLFFNKQNVSFSRGSETLWLAVDAAAL